MVEFTFSKLINVNHDIDTVISSNINEFDIQSAGPTAIRFLKGDEIYNKLMTMDKKSRNIYVGKMQRDEKGLSKQMLDLTLEWMNMFLKANKIKYTNFSHSTRDSITLVNKLPIKTTFGRGKIVFRNKEGSFSSLFRINGKIIMYDNFRNQLMVKGIDDTIVDQSVFFQKFLKKSILLIENSQKSGDRILMNALTLIRNDYLNNKDENIYRDPDNQNQFPIRYKGELAYINLERLDDTFDIAREINYNEYIMPLMRSATLNG